MFFSKRVSAIRLFSEITVKRLSSLPSWRTIMRSDRGITASMDSSSELSPGAAPWARRAMPSTCAPMIVRPWRFASAIRAAVRFSSSVMETPAAPIPLRLAPVTMITVL